MIRPIDIRLNAAHPELPLAEAVTFTGAPSTVLIRGVPPNCGRWAITAVSVAATYPDGSTTTRAAVQSANGVWVATLPATATSGRTANGLRILADGIDENGAAVTGYILGVADFAVASLGVAPAPEPGETSWQMLYFDAVPSTLRKGDVAKVDGVLKFYDGTAWQPFANIDPSNYVPTSRTINGKALTDNVSLSGSDIPTTAAPNSPTLANSISTLTNTTQTLSAAISTLNNTKASKADATLTERGFSEWTVIPGELETETPIAEWTADGWIIKGEYSGVAFTLVPKGDADSTSLSWTFPDEALANITATRTALPGYQLGSQDDKPLASEAEAEALRAGKASRATNPTAGNLAALDANGNPTDAGWTAGDIARYALTTKTIDNGAVSLDDRAMNAVAVSSALASLTVNFPTATSGKVRDFGLRLTVASGITTAPELALPQGVVCENADGEAPEIGADGAATILYFTEMASGVFLVKGEVVTAIS